MPSAFVDADVALNINVQVCINSQIKLNEYYGIKLIEQVKKTFILHIKQKENVFPPSNVTEGDSSIKLVQCPEEPEVFVRPLQAYGSIDENKHKDIDFSVPHIGKKRIITPRQFYVEMDDSDFDFVKNDTKRKT